MKIDNNLTQGVYNITLSEKFTFDDHMQFREVLKKMDEQGVSKIILHMAGVTFVDSAALGMLLLAGEEAKKNNKTLIISSPAGQVKKMFEMARFDKIFTIE
jgi:anti-anti-sigma factor